MAGPELERTYSELRRDLERQGLDAWDTNRLSETNARFGITLDWPTHFLQDDGSEGTDWSKGNLHIRAQAYAVRRTLGKYARHAGMDMLISGPVMHAGGTMVLYIGLIERKKSEKTA